MRAIVSTAVALGASGGLAACPSTSATRALAGDDGSGALGTSPDCASDSDCLLFGATCCACPSYALPVDDPSVLACEGVSCPVSTCPANVEASCVQRRCELTCAPLECDTACANGFALDANGCLTCECAVADGCGSDGDCHETGADCCGCALGGSDTAVVSPTAYQQGLGCSATPACPGDDTCDPTAAVTCIAARCFLLPAADQGVPSGACGRPELAECPEDDVCIVNSLAAATAQGIGVCLPL